MNSLSTMRRLYAIFSLSIVASIFAISFLPEKIFAINVTGGQDQKCYDEPTDSSQCAYGGSLDCPPEQPPSKGISFFCAFYHVPKVCKDTANSSCTERFDLFDCGNKKDCYDNSDVLDETWKPVKCNQLPKDCS